MREFAAKQVMPGAAAIISRSQTTGSQHLLLASGVVVQAPTAPQVTALLQAWSAGDRTALDRPSRWSTPSCDVLPGATCVGSVPDTRSRPRR